MSNLWRLGGCSGSTVIYQKDSMTVADVDLLANAERIVACVNAFDGVPIEKIADKTIGQYVASEAYLKGMNKTGDGIDIEIDGLACKALTASFAGHFMVSGAVNFLTMDLHHESIGDFSVTMQKSERLTPTQKIRELQKHNEQLVAALNRLLDSDEVVAKASDAMLLECIAAVSTTDLLREQAAAILQAREALAHIKINNEPEENQCQK